MGLAVTVSWPGTARASSYAVHRSTDPTFTPSHATRLATVTGTSLRDVAATAGRRLSYRVVPLDVAGSPVGAASRAGTVTTDDGTAGSRAAAVSWLRAQQDAAPSSPTPGLLRSFVVPADDPARGGSQTPVEDRSWIYDDAVGALALTASGQLTRASTGLSALASLQQADGSLRFSYDVPTGAAADGYARTGASAWVGTAALAYELRSGDATYRLFATRLADSLLRLQVTTANGYPTSDPRYGSLLGGVGQYDANDQLGSTPVQWASTEHNIDAYFFLRDLGYATGEPRFASAAQLVKTSLLSHHWNAAEGRFDQGIGDAAESLDLGSWGGLFLLAVGEDAKATQSATWMERFRLTGTQITRSTDPGSYNTTYTSPGPIAGYQPYGAGYVDPPATVWAEGTWGAVLFKMRRGQDVTTDLESLQRLQAADPQGGFVQVTAGRSASPYEFHVWPAVAGTGWAALVAHDADLLWKRDRWNEDPAAR